MLTNLPLFVPGGLGPLEMGILLAIFVLLFGASKLPKLARSSGQAIGEFQKGRQQIEQELDEMKDETQEVTSTTDPTTEPAATEPAGETTSETVEE